MGELVKSGSKYSDEDRRRAVVEYCVKGVMSKVAERTGIPETTLSSWKRQEWWEAECAAVRSQINEQIFAQNLEVALKANEEVMDRLKNGDEVVTKDGLQRIKMKGRDVAVVGGITGTRA